jgi:hypothetical protein
MRPTLLAHNSAGLTITRCFWTSSTGFGASVPASVWPIRVNSSKEPGERVTDAVDMDAKGTSFFQALLDEVYRREPTLRPAPQVSQSEAR